MHSTAHKRGLDRILEDPLAIGVRNVENYEVELEIRNKKGRSLTDIDLLFFTTDNGIYVVEYKSGTRPCRTKARKQVQKGALWVRQEYDPNTLVGLYVRDTTAYGSSGNPHHAFSVEEVLRWQ